MIGKTDGRNDGLTQCNSSTPNFPIRTDTGKQVIVTPPFFPARMNTNHWFIRHYDSISTPALNLAPLLTCLKYLTVDHVQYMDWALKGTY